jgi:hypothetical protein
MESISPPSLVGIIRLITARMLRLYAGDRVNEGPFNKITSGLKFSKKLETYDSPSPLAARGR